MRLSNQAGYLALLAAFMIVVIGFIGVAAVYMAVGSATATVNLMKADAAFYMAEGGLEIGSKYLLSPFLTAVAGNTQRVTCAAVLDNTNMTNITLGAGKFTVTPVSGASYNVRTLLNGDMTSSANVMTLSSVAGFAPRGRVQIDNEIINYQGISGNLLTGLLRGKSYTVASSHTSGTYVSQYQCLLDSQGGIPTLVSPVATQEVQQGIQLQDAWAVGNRTGNNFVLSRWNNPTELIWASGSYTDAANRNDLLSVSMLSNGEGWAVGTITGTAFNIVHFLNNTWTEVPTGATKVAATCNTQTLNGVSAVSSVEAWAVGVAYRANCSSGNFLYTILKWNGTQWAIAPSIPVPAATNLTLNDVKVIDSSGDGLGNFGFAVGNTGTVLQYNGTTWSKLTAISTQNLTGVSVVSTNEAWAVGSTGGIYKWTSAGGWSLFASTGTALNGIKMIDTTGNGIADVGWVVGNSGRASLYDGATWTANNPGGGNLFDVAVFNANDAWAVGASGRVTHWNGNSWINGTSNVSTQLNAISKVYPRDAAIHVYPNSGPQSNWTQIFP
jgi:Tfp pilus assembly protein PilX